MFADVSFISFKFNYQLLIVCISSVVKLALSGSSGKDVGGKDSSEGGMLNKEEKLLSVIFFLLIIMPKCCCLMFFMSGKPTTKERLSFCPHLNR